MPASETNDKRICSCCIINKYLKKRIRDSGIAGRCSECNKRRTSTVTITDFGQWIEPVLRNCLEPGDEIPFFHSDDSREWRQEGEELEDHICTFLGQELETHQDISRAVMDAESVDEQEGEHRLFDDGVRFVRRYGPPYILEERWKSIEADLKYRKRFFNPEAKGFFDTIFSDIDLIQGRTSQAVGLRGVVRVFPKGTKLFRARICPNDEVQKLMLKAPWKHIGPPPQSLATEGRMNGKGVVMFYGAIDRATCVAELRPALRAKVAVIKVATERSLRLLDFIRLENCKLPDLDYFQPDYHSEFDKFVFRLSLGKRISSPVTPGSEHDYLVTQTMAEYLAFVHKKRLDGIIFRSSQREGGKNVVLF